MKNGLKLTGKPLFLLCFLTLGFNLYAEYAADTISVTDPTEPVSAGSPQSVFALDLRRDLIISTICLGMFFGARFIRPTRIYNQYLNVNDINAIDRGLVRFYRNQSLHVASVTLASWINGLPIIVPLALVEWRDLRSDFNIWFTYGVMYVQAFVFKRTIRGAMGRMVGRPRPHHYLDGFIEGPISVNSFPSGTTAAAFMPATFLSVTFSAEFPDSQWRIPIIVGSHTLAALAGAGRIIAGTHFLTDVLAGAAIGSFIGWLIPTLHRRPDESNFSVYFTGNGKMLSLRL